jgi:methylated-DNA-[protein]-cysteine S-methyltransferase
MRPAMQQIFYSLFATSLGVCGIAWKGPGLKHSRPVVLFLQLPEATEQVTEERIVGSTGGRKSDPPPATIAEIAARIRSHLQGEARDFSDIRVDLEGLGGFTQQVLAACRNIPAGRTLSYSELARVIHRPKAARAVGQALARNPVPLIIPCHRVLALGGQAGGFSAPGGVETKMWLLAREGVRIKEEKD